MKTYLQTLQEIANNDNDLIIEYLLNELDIIKNDRDYWRKKWVKDTEHFCCQGDDNCEVCI